MGLGKRRVLPVIAFHVNVNPPRFPLNEPNVVLVVVKEGRKYSFILNMPVYIMLISPLVQFYDSAELFVV